MASLMSLLTSFSRRPSSAQASLENSYNFDDIIRYREIKKDIPLNKIFVEHFEKRKSIYNEIVNENKKLNDKKKQLIADILYRYINNLEMIFEPNKIVNVKINGNYVNLILITVSLPVIIVGDLEYGYGDDNILIIKRYDYLIDFNTKSQITIFADNYNMLSFKIGTDYLVIIQECLIKKLESNKHIRSSLSNYIDILTKFEIWDFKFVNKFTLLCQSVVDTGIIYAIAKTFSDRKDDPQVRKFIFTTNIFNDFYRESYPHHESPMNRLFKENNTTIANYFKFHTDDANFQTTFMTKLFNKYGSVLKIYGIILIEKINNVIFKYRTKFVKEIFDIIKTSNYIIKERSLNYGNIKDYLIGEFIKNDGQVDLNSIKFLIPFFINIFGYYFNLAPENKIFEIDIKNDYEIPLISDLEKFTEFGNQKSEDKQDTYIDPISYDDVKISDPNARIIFCNNTSYVFDCIHLIELIERQNSSNPITQTPFTSKEIHYIRFGNLDSYDEPDVVLTPVIVPTEPVAGEAAEAVAGEAAAGEAAAGEAAEAAE